MTGEGGDDEREQNIFFIFSTLRRDSRLVWTLNHKLSVRHRNTTFGPRGSTYRLIWCVCWPGRGETSATEEKTSFALKKTVHKNRRCCWRKLSLKKRLNYAGNVCAL